MAWNAADPLNFYIDGQYAAKRDLSGDEWLKFDVTVLLKHGEYYLHAFTAPLSVVQCRDVVAIDTTSTPQVTGLRDDEAMATSTAFTADSKREMQSWDGRNESIEVRKSVTFSFKKADSAPDSDLTKACLAEAPQMF